tara:strand:+ start:426 stop:647 length:222 start_codon:yes stop_codon:yes gene_type:complete
MKFTFSDEHTPSPLICPTCKEIGEDGEDIERYEIHEGQGKLVLYYRCFPYGHEWLEVWRFESYTVTKGEEEDE